MLLIRLTVFVVRNLFRLLVVAVVLAFLAGAVGFGLGHTSAFRHFEDSQFHQPQR